MYKIPSSYCGLPFKFQAKLILGDYMLYIPFWILLIVLLVIVFVVAYIRKFDFIDVQLVIMVSLAAFVFDMTFAKWLRLYYYIDINYTAFYSLLACLFIYPSLGFIFYKFLPSQKEYIAGCVVVWLVALAVFEVYIVMPYRIVIYTGWIILPWSLLVYVLSFSWEYVCGKILSKHTKAKNG